MKHMLANMIKLMFRNMMKHMLGNKLMFRNMLKLVFRGMIKHMFSKLVFSEMIKSPSTCSVA